MRLLVFGHLSHTGFGTVTSEIAGRLIGHGVDVRVIAVNHRGEPVKGPLAGHVWPAAYYGEPFAANWSGAAITGEAWAAIEPGDDWKPDAVLAISDVSGLLSHIGRDVDSWKGARVLHYCPIEGDNLPPTWRAIWNDVAEPVAMSDYGQRVISEHIGRPVPRIYHGVDTDTFYPVSPGRPIYFEDATLREKADCKRVFGLDPERKVILRTDRNVTRKNSDALLQTFALIAREDPDVDLVLHCKAIDPQGVDMVQELLRLPDDIRARIRFTEAHDTFKGLPVEALNALYNAADLYLTTTGGEGFGLTLAESMAAGVPVVSTGWAAEVEVIGEGGILVPPLHDKYGNPVVYHSTYGMDWAVPDPKAFVEPVLRLLSHPGQRKALGAAGRLHVKRSFSWDEAAVAFYELLQVPVEAAA